MYFFYFVIHLSLEKGRTLRWNKLQSPLPKDALLQIWLKLALWRSLFLKKKSSMYFCYFVISSSCKGRDPLFVQTWITSTQECFLPSSVEIGPVALEKRKYVNVKFTDKRTEGRRTKGDQINWLELLAPVS